MASNENQNELLLRYLDGSLDPNDQAIVANLLRKDADARAFLRGVAAVSYTHLTLPTNREV